MADDKKKKQDADDKDKINANPRGAKDDWELLALVLDENPHLRQRVLHKLRDLKSQSDVIKGSKSILSPDLMEKKNFRS